MQKIWLVLLVFLISCSNKEKVIQPNKTSENSAIADTTKSMIVNQDKFTVKGKEVVFFMPSPKEQYKLKTLYGNVAQWEFDAMFRNFQHLAKTARSALRKYGISTVLTYAKEFDIQLDTAKITLNLNELNQIIGFILTNGKKYEIYYGVYSNKDFSQVISDFYKINFRFGYQPIVKIIQDSTENPNAAP